MSKVVIWYGAGRSPQSLISPADVARLRSVCRVGEIIGASPDLPVEQVVAQSRDAQVVVSTWGSPCYTAAVLDGCPQLRLMVRIGGGALHHVIDDSAWERGIQVSTTIRAQAKLLADLTLTLILAGLHRLPRIVLAQHRDEPLDPHAPVDGLPQRTLFEKRVGLVGFGAIARQLTKLLVPFRCEVLAYDPNVDDACFQEAGVQRCDDLVELAAQCAVLSIHAAYKPMINDGMIDARVIDALPTDGLLVNTSYGELIEVPALMRRLNDGSLSACLDMIDGGWGHLDGPLRHSPYALLTPTISGNSDGVPRLMGREAVDEVIRFIRGQSLHHVVEQRELAYRA